MWTTYHKWRKNDKILKILNEKGVAKKLCLGYHLPRKMRPQICVILKKLGTLNIEEEYRSLKREIISLIPTGGMWELNKYKFYKLIKKIK